MGLKEYMERITLNIKNFNLLGLLEHNIQI